MADKQFVAVTAILLDVYKHAAWLKANDDWARKVIMSDPMLHIPRRSSHVSALCFQFKI